MKKIGLLTLLLGLISFCGLSANASEEFSVAIVDIPQVVSASAKVQALKKEQEANSKEIMKYIEKARKDIATVTDADKKKEMEDKYNKELIAKKEKMDLDYANKLKALDSSISQTINTKAKADGYDLVLSKGVVLYGGKDITEEIVKLVK